MPYIQNVNSDFLSSTVVDSSSVSAIREGEVQNIVHDVEGYPTEAIIGRQGDKYCLYE